MNKWEVIYDDHGIIKYERYAKSHGHTVTFHIGTKTIAVEEFLCIAQKHGCRKSYTVYPVELPMDVLEWITNKAKELFKEAY